MTASFGEDIPLRSLSLTTAEEKLLAAAKTGTVFCNTAVQRLMKLEWAQPLVLDAKRAEKQIYDLIALAGEAVRQRDQLESIEAESEGTAQGDSIPDFQKAARRLARSIIPTIPDEAFNYCREDELVNLFTVAIAEAISKLVLPYWHVTNCVRSLLKCRTEEDITRDFGDDTRKFVVEIREWVASLKTK